VVGKIFYKITGSANLHGDKNLLVTQVRFLNQLNQEGKEGKQIDKFRN
jgi:hypothetical protein